MKTFQQLFLVAVTAASCLGAHAQGTTNNPTANLSQAERNAFWRKAGQQQGGPVRVITPYGEVAPAPTPTPTPAGGTPAANGNGAPQVPAQTQVAPAQATPVEAPHLNPTTAAQATGGTGQIPLHCFEVIEMNNFLLVNALRNNGLLCPNQVRGGTPVAIMADRSGNLSVLPAGNPTAWHRTR